MKNRFYGCFKLCYYQQLYVPTFFTIQMVFPYYSLLLQLYVLYEVIEVSFSSSFLHIGYQCSYVYLSALFTLLAIFVRQTNIILTVLNPAIILLLRVLSFFYFFLSSMAYYIRMTNSFLLLPNYSIFSPYFSRSSVS